MFYKLGSILLPLLSTNEESANFRTLEKPTRPSLRKKAVVLTIHTPIKPLFQSYR